MVVSRVPTYTFPQQRGDRLITAKKASTLPKWGIARISASFAEQKMPIPAGSKQRGSTISPVARPTAAPIPVSKPLSLGHLANYAWTSVSNPMDQLEGAPMMLRCRLKAWAGGTALAAFSILTTFTIPADARNGYTLQEKATIKACIEKAQRNSQHARVCIGEATQVCETLREMANQAGIQDCMSREAAYWDEILNDRYQKLMANFSKTNARKLQAMQRRWIDWRKEKCQLPAMLYEGGSMANVMAANCMMETTAIRALELDEAVIAP